MTGGAGLGGTCLRRCGGRRSAGAGPALREAGAQVWPTAARRRFSMWSRSPAPAHRPHRMMEEEPIRNHAKHQPKPACQASGVTRHQRRALPNLPVWIKRAPHPAPAAARRNSGCPGVGLLIGQLRPAAECGEAGQHRARGSGAPAVPAGRERGITATGIRSALACWSGVHAVRGWRPLVSWWPVGLSPRWIALPILKRSSRP